VISTPHYSYVDDIPLLPGFVQTRAVDTQLIADLSPGNLHAYATSGATLTNPNAGIDPGGLIRGYSRLDVSSIDHLTFLSSTLPAGSDVTYELTGILHSTIAADQTGGCAAGDPAASAAMTVGAGFEGIGISFQFAPGTFLHTSCGLGGDLMTATQVLHATIGGPRVGILTNFSIFADAGLQNLPGVPYTQTVRQTVDASNTGSIMIRVLTPGVTFASASGYGYGPLDSVPEPAGWTLMITGLGGVGASLRRLRTSWISS
jgi:hypothetical protein